MAYETSLRPYFVRMTCGHVEIRLMREATARMPWTPTNAVDAGVPCRYCRGEADPHIAPNRLHGVDTQCCIDTENDACLICNVSFGEPCKTCRGRGFHFPGCSDPSNDEAMTPVKLSTESAGECVAGCGNPAFAYGCAALKGYVDACGDCAPMVLKDAVAAQKEGT